MEQAIVARINGLYYVLEYCPRDCVWYDPIGKGFEDSFDAEEEARERNDDDDEEE